MPQTHYSKSTYGCQKTLFVFKDDAPTSLLFMIVVYILYICCQVCAKLGGSWIQLWNKLLTNKKAAKPTVPSRVQTESLSPLIQLKGSSPGCYVLKKKRKKKKEVPFYFVCGLHQLSWKCVWIFVRKRMTNWKWKTLGTLRWTVVDSPPSNKHLSTGEAGWSGLPPHTLQYSKTAHRMNTGLLSGYIF